MCWSLNTRQVFDSSSCHLLLSLRYLLRSVISITMLRDDNLYPMAARNITLSPTDQSDEADMDGHREEVNYANDDLDSIFGSEPSSPILGPVDTSSLISPSHHTRTAEISDIPRLREKHETEGYRDGVTEGKARHMQEGFDEGYTLGAVLGLRVGKVLGLLEGIASAVGDEKMSNEAKADLSAEKVFGKEYWDEEGIWRWKVDGEGEGDAEVVFEDVVAQHPLVKKWEGIVGEEVKRLGIDLKVWEGEDGHDIDEGVLKKKGAKPSGDIKEEVTPAAGKILGVQREKLSW